MDGRVFERLRRVDHRVWDALLAVAVTAAGLLALAIEVRVGDRGLEPDAVALVVASGAALAWRRRAPLVVVVVVGASVAAFSLLGHEPALYVPHAIAMYTAAAERERALLWSVLPPLALATSIGFQSTESPPAWEGGLNWPELVTTATITSGLAVAFGRMTFNRRRRIARDRDLAARQAVVAERARIARELHDVVAHHLSVMVVQAGAARSVGERDPAAAADALRQVEESGRTGLGEMRRLLELLKADDATGERAPQPGLAHLDELLDGMRATGLPVEAVVEGPSRPLPDGIDLSAYRIVQEALTNTLRHAGPASARVLLRYEPDAVEIEIADDGIGAPPGDDGAGGHGLIGMRERAQLFGGTLEAGPRPGGGYVVRARLPAGAQP